MFPPGLHPLQRCRSYGAGVGPKMELVLACVNCIAAAIPRKDRKERPTSNVQHPITNERHRRGQEKLCLLLLIHGFTPVATCCRSLGAVVKIANMHCSINFWHYFFLFKSNRTKVSMAMHILEQRDFRLPLRGN